MFTVLIGRDPHAEEHPARGVRRRRRPRGRHGVAAPAANAVELAPYAHQLDMDVAATGAEVGAAIDALDLAAE